MSSDPGVYGLLYRSKEDENAYVVLFRPSHSIVLRRLTLFHELAHLIFDYELPDMRSQGALRCALMSDATEIQAEAFAIGAMHYSFIHTPSVLRINWEEDVVSAFGSYLKRTAYWS
ncbi:MAG: ImmA/IrrE family metallo-endopeptidase [Candidatus Tectimicrobiota bacterium]